MKGYRIEFADGICILRSHRAELSAPIELAVFQIDYNRPDDKLVDEFKNWLKARRREKQYAPQERRGRSDARRCRSELNALGASRLLSSGFSIKQAIDFTDRESGSPLYDDPSNWSKTRSTVEGALDRAN